MQRYLYSHMLQIYYILYDCIKCPLFSKFFWSNNFENNCVMIVMLISFVTALGKTVPHCLPDPEFSALKREEMRASESERVSTNLCREMQLQRFLEDF